MVHTRRQINRRVYPPERVISLLKIANEDNTFFPFFSLCYFYSSAFYRWLVSAY